MRVAKIYDDGVLQLKGELIEGENLNLDRDGNFSIGELIENGNNKIQIKGDKTYVREFIEIDGGVLVDWHIATKEDFYRASGEWVYRGNEEYVDITSFINNQSGRSTSNMFENVFVKGVKSNNNNILSTNFMFKNSLSNHTINLSEFNLENVHYMVGMFENSSFNYLDLSKNTAKPGLATSMFENAEIKTLDLSNFDYSNAVIIDIFRNARIKRCYVKTQENKEILQKLSNTPKNIEFIVKER